ncbi:MAG: extracellular solute-binding protein [Hyphomicrobiales bacterium]|nr:extracellular solute-binding protein [Hyphomicrobiales bacterium]
MQIRPFAAAFLAASTFLGGHAAQAQERQKFEFWYGLTGRLGEIMEEHCKRFNDSQTKYEAKCVGQGGYDKAEQNTIAAFRSKQHPTLVQIYDAGTVNFMLSGATYNAPQLAKDFNMKVDWSAYFPGIANYYATSKGEMWSFPYNSSSALLYWNKDAWAKIGKSKAPETVEEWFDDLRAMKKAGVECGFAFDYDTWMPLEQFSAIHNIPIATKNNGYDGLDAEMVFNKTKFADYMKDWKKLLDEGVARIQTAQTGKTILQAFTDGTCASMLSSVANHGVVGSTAKADLKWGVAKLPVYKDFKRHNSLVGGASLWVLQGKSKGEYEAAAAYIQFLLQPKEEQWFADVTGYIPVTKTGFKAMVDGGFYADPKRAGRELAIESLTFTPPTAVSRGIRLGNFTQIRAEIRAELEAAFTGKKDMQAALDEAVARSNQILRRFEQTFKGKQLP